MRTGQLKKLIQLTPIVASVIGIAVDAGYATGTVQSIETGKFGEPETISISTETIVSSTEFQPEQIASATFETVALPIAATQTSQSSEQPDSLPIPVVSTLSSSQQYVFQTRSLAKPLVEINYSNPVNSVVTDSDLKLVIENITIDLVNASYSTEVPPKLEPISLSSADLGAAQSVDHQPIAQAETPAESDNPEPVSESEESSPRWRFTITPYAFVPLSAEGGVTVRDFTADIDLGLDDILSPLNFAAAGRVEAWRGHLGIIFDGSYFNLSQDNTRSLPIPNCLCDIFPSKITTDVTVQYGQFDLGVGYRISENANQATNEFELGPLAFDAILGIRIYALQQEIDVSTNLGTSRNVEGSGTLVQPLVSGRLRWNLSPKLAGWVRGDLAGLGIGGTLMAASFTGGLDWMFSGDTSLLLAYRLSSLEYNTDVGEENLELDLLFHGPYLGVVFRF